MARSRAAKVRKVLLKSLLITVAAVAVMGVIGFALGGWAGAQGGAMWGLVAGAMAVPGLLLGIALNAGEDLSQQILGDWGERRYGSGPGE
ncbi:MAG: hypothetical protein ABIQ15_02935 [Nocardioides sp.]